MLLDRLATKKILQLCVEGWVVGPHDYAALLKRHIERFLEVYVGGDLEGLALLWRCLEERTGERGGRVTVLDGSQVG